jgi:hypothetical protein
MKDSTPAEKARIEKEQAQMRAAILDVHHQFAWFECGFAWLLRNALRAAHPDAASHIYFSPAATETRIRIVDSVLRLTVAGHRYGDRFLVQWDRIMNRAARIRKTRNEIIHGQIVEVRLPASKTSKVRLVAVLADTERTIRQQENPKQYPGMSPNDVRQNAESMKDLSRDGLLAQQFIDAVWEADDAASLQILIELESRHQKDGRT